MAEDNIIPVGRGHFPRENRQMLFIIKNENLLAAEKGCNSMLYIEESSFI